MGNHHLLSLQNTLPGLPLPFAKERQRTTNSKPHHVQQKHRTDAKETQTDLFSLPLLPPLRTHFLPDEIDRLLRKEEREAAKAEADARWQQMQESCDVPEGISRKAMAARENGKKGGRPRKNPVMNTTQRSIPLMSTVDGGKGAAENPSKKPITGLGYETSVSSVSIDRSVKLLKGPKDPFFFAVMQSSTFTSSTLPPV